MPYRVLIALCFLAPLVEYAHAAALPAFQTDLEADRWLRTKSPAYLQMAERVDAQGGYTFIRNADIPGGLAYFQSGRGFIELSESLKGAHRVSVLIFEITNLAQENRHREVTDRVRRGELNTPSVFGMLREIIEYDGLRLHHTVLADLQRVLDPVPPEMITWVSSTAKTYAEYQVPFVYDYLRAQAASGHTDHYIKIFEKHRAEFLATQPGK